MIAIWLPNGAPTATPPLLSKCVFFAFVSCEDCYRTVLADLVSSNIMVVTAVRVGLVIKTQYTVFLNIELKYSPHTDLMGIIL